VSSGASYCHECSDTSIKTYIDDFFESGHLRLSSFDHFKSHTDVERLDANEGEGVHFGEYRSPHDPDDASTVAMVTGTGQSFYVLCGSILESTDLLSDFGSDGYFVIENPTGFANEVRRHVTGCLGGLQGHCIYPPRGRGVSRRLDENPRQIIEDATRADGTVDMAAIPAMASLTVGNESFFTKDSRYRHQAEYGCFGVWTIALRATWTSCAQALESSA
jgi:hypothetical protein